MKILYGYHVIKTLINIIYLLTYIFIIFVNLIGYTFNFTYHIKPQYTQLYYLMLQLA